MTRRFILTLIATSFVLVSCDADTFIVDESATRGCIDGPTAYLNVSEDGGAICHSQSCVGRAYQRDEVNTCSGKVSCKSGNHGELLCGDCLNGDKKCANDDNKLGHIYQCVAGTWVEVTPCSSAGASISCRDDNVCGACLNGDKQFVDVMGLCFSNACVNGAYVRDNSNFCAQDNVTVNSCQINEAENAYLCGECYNYDSRCVEDENGVAKMQICQRGTWVDSALCTGIDGAPTRCHDAGTQCLYCEPETFRYENSRENDSDVCVVYQCQEDENGKTEWVKLDKDDENQCRGDVSCGVQNDALFGCGQCLNYSRVCKTRDDASFETGKAPDAMYYCIDGNWVFNNDCIGSSCGGDLECGECINEQTRYVNDDVIKCHHQTCQNGKWANEDSESVCEASCLDNATETHFCGECIDDSIRCQEDNVEQCVKGEWRRVKVCGENGEPAKCVEGSCGECQENDEKYEDTQVGCVKYLCQNYAWEGDANWVNGNQYSCARDDNGNTTLGVCQNGNFECETSIENGETQGVQYRCREGKWEVYQTCDAGCYDEKICNEVCNKTYQQCDGDILKKCKLNQNVEFETCEFSCHSSEDKDKNDACGVCQNETTKCETDGDGIGKIYSCANGTWSETAQSSCDNVSCDTSGNQCGTCKNGEDECQNDGFGGVIKHCADGRWNRSFCENSRTCVEFNGGHYCGDCRDGDKKTDDGKDNKCHIFECQNGRWVSVHEYETSCKTDGSNQKVAGDCLNWKFSWISSGIIQNRYQLCIDGKNIGLGCKRLASEFGAYIGCSALSVQCKQDKDTDATNGVEIGILGKEKDTSCTVNRDGSTTSGECANGTQRCVNKVSQTCFNGRWSFDRSCWSDCDSDGKKCLEE